ncbi:hypothetical protein T484DRAFT_1808943 [Baffinella frigidus]|nr:hypothetical protein T484DRAFT_1808943 [Cryptophyta sp. CCMP2293]
MVGRKRGREESSVQPPGGATKPLRDLSVEEVCALLHSLGLGKYAAGFAAARVDGRELCLAGDGDLAKVGIDLATPRRALLDEIEAFKAGGVPLAKLSSQTGFGPSFRAL